MLNEMQYTWHWHVSVSSFDHYRIGLDVFVCCKRFCLMNIENQFHCTFFNTKQYVLIYNQVHSHRIEIFFLFRSFLPSCVTNLNMTWQANFFPSKIFFFILIKLQEEQRNLIIKFFYWRKSLSRNCHFRWISFFYFVAFVWSFLRARCIERNEYI